MKDLKIDESTGLVLEGGGMRGVFTCGVLDYFMDHDIRFPYAIGVSAGACNGLSYASRQRGRAKYSNIDLLEKYDYIGLKHLLKKRNILDFDLLFNEFPEHILHSFYDRGHHLFGLFVRVGAGRNPDQALSLLGIRGEGRVSKLFHVAAQLVLHFALAYAEEVYVVRGYNSVRERREYRPDPVFQHRLTFARRAG